MTLVTATIRDQAGNTYANALVEASFLSNIPPGTGSGPPLASGSVFQTFAVSETDSFGNLSMSLTDLAAITPSGGSWNFNVLNNARTIGFSLNSFAITGTTVDISAALQAASAPLNPATSFGNITVTGLTSTGLMLTKNLEQTRFADQFAGADMGAKINAAIADLPSSGGIVDATAFQGAQSAAATITLNKPMVLLLGAVTLTMAGSPGIAISATGASVMGLGQDTTILITSSGTADIIQVTSPFWYVSKLGFRSSVARTAGAGLNMAAGSSNGTGSCLRFDKTWNGINCSSQTNTGNCYFNDIQMGAGLSAMGNWNAGIFLGNVNSGTVASIGFDGVRITGDATFATAMVVLDSGTDTIMFVDSQFVQSGVSNVCLLVQKTGASLTPSWARFANCSFEAFTATTAINVTSCNNLKFINCQIANSQTGILVNPASPANVQDMRYINGSFIICQQSSVVLNNCTGGVEVSNCWIADSSQQTNGGFNAIAVNGNCANFWFNHNSFALSGRGSGFLPFVDIAINNAGCDSFDLIGNSFIQGIANNSTGTNYFIHSNIPAQANIFNGAMTFKAGINTPVGLGTTNQPNVGLISLPSNLTGTSQFGLQSAPQTSSASTIEGSGLVARADTVAAAFTQALNTGVHVATPIVGAGSTITEWQGVRIDAGPTAGTKFAIKSIGAEPWWLGGKVGVYNTITTAGNGVASIYGATSQKSESAADTNVLTFTPPAAVGSYRLRFTMAVSAQNTATLGWTATWKDANGAAQAPTNLSLFTSGTAAPALTVTAATNGNYYGYIDIDTDASATAIVVKLTFTGTSFNAKVSATIERII